MSGNNLQYLPHRCWQCSLADVGQRVADVAGSLGAVDGLDRGDGRMVLREQLANPPIQLVQRRPVAAGDVEHLMGRPAREGQRGADVRLHYIVDVYHSYAELGSEEWRRHW